MIRIVRVALGLALALALVGSTACQKKVEVETGTRVQCTFGHSVSDDVRIVKVSAKDAGKYRIVTKTVVCPKHQKLEALYAQAQDDISEGDLKAAQTKLEQIAALDPAFRQVATQIETIKQGKKPAVDTGSSSGSGSSTATDPAQPNGGGDKQTSGLAGWIPDTIAGFSAKKPLIEPVTATREYLPSSQGKADALIVVAEQFRTASAAKSGLAKVKQAYSVGGGSATAGGHDGYFATDGRRFAVFAFNQGAVLVVLEMAAVPTAKPAELKSILLKAAEDLP